MAETGTNTRKPRATKGPSRAVGGREKLIDAVMQLGAATRSIASLGLREVARQAGLNPNTFYRHFKDFDELGLALIDKLSAQLRSGLRAQRERPGRHGVQSLTSIVRQSVKLLFDFVLEHNAAYVIGIRELHGGSPALRQALRKVMDDLADEMTEDAIRLLRVPELDAGTVRELSLLVIRQMSFLALDYLEQPEKRAALREQAEHFILLLFWGALAAKAPHVLEKARDDLQEVAARLSSGTK